MKRISTGLLILLCSSAFASDQLFRLGQSLYFDKILSGNKNISCATCHHPLTGTSDAISLGVGEGGLGMGITRTTGASHQRIQKRIARNANQLWNLGDASFKKMFHDGRIELNPKFPSGISTPSGMSLPKGLSGVVAAQSLFPPTAIAEMAGQKGESAVSDAAAAENFFGAGGVWDLLSKRIQNIPAYVKAFKASYKDIKDERDIGPAHIANAIAHYEIKAFVADKSPYDLFLKGDESAMSELAKKGMKIFNGKAGCVRCHSGPLQTDQRFHAIGMPQIGPGKGHGSSQIEDIGRGKITSKKEDYYKFKTPSLRNVALTAPYGHSGAFTKLRDMVLHHLDSEKSFNNYDISKARLPSRKDLDDMDMVVMRSPALKAKILAANELKPVKLTTREVDALVAFLHSLTDPNCLDMGGVIPKRVLSGLPINE